MHSGSVTPKKSEWTHFLTSWTITLLSKTLRKSVGLQLARWSPKTARSVQERTIRLGILLWERVPVDFLQGR